MEPYRLLTVIFILNIELVSHGFAYMISTKNKRKLNTVDIKLMVFLCGHEVQEVCI